MKKNRISGVAVYKDTNGKTEFWRVRLGKRFTGGKTIKKTFATYGAANDWVETQHHPKEALGSAYFDLTPSQLAESRNAFQRLADIDAATKPTLTEAVSFYIKHAFPSGGMRSFEELADEFLNSRKAMNCKPRTMRLYKSYFSILAQEFGELKLHELRRTDIEDWLAESEWGPRTRKNYLVTLTTLFNFAVEREYCGSNPAGSIPRPILDDRPPGILTPSESENLLKAGLSWMPKLVPAIAVGLFAGLRRSEICSLDWKELDLNGLTIEVLGTKAKTRQRRLVTIQPNLAAWLRPVAQSMGPVAPDVEIFGAQLRQLVRGSEAQGTDPGRPPVVEEWPHNALRHSFGSYFFAKSRNENLTACEMGNSPAMVFKHYRALVKPEDMEKYWQILPDKTIT